MLSELQRKKLVGTFRKLDIDQNGRVEREDFDGAARRIADVRGVGSSSPQYKALLSRYEGIWQELRDGVGSEHITLDEWLAYHEDLLSDRDRLEEGIVGLANVIFDVLDADGDGLITRDEYRKYLEAHGLDAARADEVFQRLDRNDDGYISRAEVEHIVVDYYFKEDPSSPIELIFGPVDAQ
jgi:Ca2+-binding EF-hand superfamily protein